MITTRTRVAALLAAAASCSFAALVRADAAADLTAAVAAWLASLERRPARHRALSVRRRGALRPAARADRTRGPAPRRDERRAVAGVARRARHDALDARARRRSRRSWPTSARSARATARACSARWFGGFVHGEERYYASVYGVPGEGDAVGAALRRPPRLARLDRAARGRRLGDAAVPRRRAARDPGGPRARRAARARRGGGPRLCALERAAPRAAHRGADRVRVRVGDRRDEPPAVPRRGTAGGARRRRAGSRAPTSTPRSRRCSTRSIATYYANFSDAIAAERLAAIDAAGRDAIHFALGGQPARPASRATTACRARPS